MCVAKRTLKQRLGCLRFVELGCVCVRALCLLRDIILVMGNDVRGGDIVSDAGRHGFGMEITGK